MIRSEMSFEVVAKTPDIAEKAIHSHIEKLNSISEAKILSSEFKEPMKIRFNDKIPEAYSVVAHCTIDIPSLYDLINIILVYGPSAVEVVEPGNINVDIGEMQNIANMISSVMHKYAAAGIGGIVISNEV